MKNFFSILGLLLFLSYAASGQTAKEWNKQGTDHFKKLEYKEAFECFTKAIELDPNYGEAYYNRANAWYQLPADAFPKYDGCADLNKAKALGIKNAEKKLNEYGCK